MISGTVLTLRSHAVSGVKWIRQGAPSRLPKRPRTESRPMTRQGWALTFSMKVPTRTWVWDFLRAAPGIAMEQPRTRHSLRSCKALYEVYFWSLLGFPRTARILYVYDCIFFPSRLTTHSSFALSPLNSAWISSTSGIRQLL